MDELARLTPSSRLWITRMTFNGSILKISAMALDNATVADYMETIITSPYFRSAQLSGTSTKGVSGRQLKSFSLTIGVVNADYQKEKTGDKKAKK
jgi:Tfp pilus assembly protein PilN